MKDVADVFRKLRAESFDAMLAKQGHERQLETAEQEERRTRQNAQLRAAYDEQTEAIIAEDLYGRVD